MRLFPSYFAAHLPLHRAPVSDASRCADAAGAMRASPPPDDVSLSMPSRLSDAPPAAPRLRRTRSLLQGASAAFSRLAWPLKIAAVLMAVTLAPLCVALLAGALVWDMLSRPSPLPPATEQAFVPAAATQEGVEPGEPAEPAEPAEPVIPAFVPRPLGAPARPAAQGAVPQSLRPVAPNIRPQGASRPVPAPPAAIAPRPGHPAPPPPVAPAMDARPEGQDWQAVDLRAADRLGAYAYQHGVACDAGSLQALSCEGGFVWRDLLASGDSPASLEAAARRELAKNPRRTRRKVLALVWHLMERGVEKDQGFGEGAFTCADPGQQLGAFLRGVGYARISSHLTHDDGDTFGIDIVGEDIGLPAQHRHVLCKIYRSLDGQTRVFIKPEAWGVRGVTAFAGHSLDYLVSVARKASPLFGSDTEPGMRKERIPQKLVAEYAWLIAGLPGAKESLAEVGRSGRGQGIAAMQQFLRQRLAQPELPRATAAVLHEFIQRLEEAYDHLDVRIGSEVVIELPGVAPAP